ncbi:1-phosphofructokinase [Bacillus suaedaesalsae]|uniref:1-phosphofructokinase n=1 Tax=Bacillus suaedaesalsae TaxID=2810349 RepID=A0ABS2DK92_9BACI|nr:1-phosphofructokinase [Bacillus suaedaesalsae]MBM6618922.1 1-phosphofructokinase [Bacillus suaedaesalsae]
MIYTCTLNPSIDYVVTVEDVKLGELNRTNETAFYPGGKGINVSRVLKRLGIDSVALGFVGGFTGDYIKSYLQSESISTSFIQHEEPTRINIKLKADVETEINGSGPIISKDHQEALYEQVSSLTEKDYFVLAGSFPPSVSLEFFKSLATLCNEKGIPLVADVSGTLLHEVLQYKPYLIKPNHHELGELVGAKIETKQEAIQYGRKLLERGPQNIIISMGGQGAVLVSHHMVVTAQVPKGEVKNSVGAGDSTVAGFLAALTLGETFEHAFRFGVASGTATAFSADLCEKKDVEKILLQIEIEVVE